MQTEDVASGWMATDYGIVALLDALATKGILATKSASSVVADWSEVIAAVTAGAHDAESRPECLACQPVALSDTIFIPMVPRDRSDIPTLLSLMCNLLKTLVFESLGRGTFFRGAVSAGRFFQTGTKLFGPAIDEAASWYEQADWIGVTATPTLARLLDMYALNQVDLSEQFLPYTVPYKGGRGIDQWALNWPAYAISTTADPEIEVLDAFYAHAGAVVPEVAAKYDQTLAFYRHTAKRYGKS